MDDAPSPPLDGQDLVELARLVAWPNADPYGWISRRLLRDSLPRLSEITTST